MTGNKTIQTSRFGDIEIQDDLIVHFSDGIIGFSVLKDYVLIESPQMPLVLWLQSVDAPEIAFPVTEPYFFKRDYKAPMTEADKFSLKFADGDTLKLFVIMTIPPDMSRMTVNMKAPLVVDVLKSTGTQLVLQDKTLEVKTPAYEAFQDAMSKIPLELEAPTSSPTADENLSFNIVPLRATQGELNR